MSLSRAGSALGGQHRGDSPGKGAHGHGLEKDAARPGDYGVEEALAAEEDIFNPLDALNVNGAGGVHHGQVARVNHHLLARGQGILHAVAVDLQKGHAPARQLLHNEALAAEKARSHLLLEEHRQLHPLLRGQVYPG